MNPTTGGLGSCFQFLTHVTGEVLLERTRNPQNTLVSSHFPSGLQSLPKFGNMFIKFNMANKNPHFPYDSEHARLHVHVTHQKRGPNAARQLVAVGDMKTSN
jgi:hypothetical protein